MIRDDRRIRLSRVLLAWALITLVACLGYLLYLRTLPPDELVMANTLSFQVLVSALFVAVPSFGLLLVFLLVGAILRSIVAQRKRRRTERKEAHAL